MLGMLKTVWELRKHRDLIVDTIFDQAILVRLGDLRLLLQSAPNVAVCKGFWYCTEPLALSRSDAVAVFYDYAVEPGKVAFCSGNNWKPDYRRLSYVSYLERSKDTEKPVYQEIPNLLNDDNMIRLYAGIPLLRRLKP